MALKTLRRGVLIDGYPVKEVTAKDDTEAHDFSTSPILIQHEFNVIAFKIQEGPIKEVGVNGCQVDTLIETARLMVEGLNKQFPCPENTAALNALAAAIEALRMRKADRTARGVEGRTAN